MKVLNVLLVVVVAGGALVPGLAEASLIGGDASAAFYDIPPGFPAGERNGGVTVASVAAGSGDAVTLGAFTINFEDSSFIIDVTQFDFGPNPNLGVAFSDLDWGVPGGIVDVQVAGDAILSLSSFSANQVLFISDQPGSIGEQMIVSLTVEHEEVPEPGSGLLALAGLGVLGRRRG